MPRSCPRLPAAAGALMLLAAGCGPDAVLPDLAVRGGVLADPGAIEGRYEMRIATMLDGTTRRSHHVHTPDGTVELDLAEPMAERIEYQSWVRVPGRAGADGHWDADDLLVLAAPPEPLVDPELREPRRIGTVLVFWGDQGLPNGVAKGSMYAGPRSTNVYYGENSYGIETLTGTIFGPYQVEEPDSCDVQLIKDRAEAEMIDRGHDPTRFDQMMFYFPNGTNCGFAGLASVGSPDNPARNSWYHGSFGCTTRNQELGHNYGMGHSHAYACPNELPEGLDHHPYEDCEHIEYGHPYDPMGDGCGHMNVVQKTYMGWLEGCNIVTATSDGIFNLMPTELPCDGTQALRFAAYDDRHYYVEYRNGAGPFAAGSGVLINLAPAELDGFGPTNYVLDEQGEFTNGYLHEGDSFTDPGSATTFTVLEEHPTHVVIQVSIDGGGDGLPPTCFGDAGEPVMDGDAVGSLTCAAEPYPADDSPPEVRITYPEDGQQFDAGVTFDILAEATDDRQVMEVELYLGGQRVEVLSEPPWEWPAINVPAGSYEFGVVARDARNETPSLPVTIQVIAEEIPSEDSTGGDGSTGDGSTGDGGTGDGGAIEPVGGGCNCRQGAGGSGGVGSGLMLLGLGWARRRRR